MVVVIWIATQQLSAASMGAIPTTTSAQTLGLKDSEMGTSVSLPYVPDATRDNLFVNADASLASFFERPLIIASYTWTPFQVGAFLQTFDPWSLFFGNKRNINRLNNYAVMRSNLHVRFMVNGNGFYFGRLMASYLPLASFDQVTSTSGTAPELVQASQQMKVFIDPSGGCSCELDLPFVWIRDGVSVPLAEWSKLGNITIRQMQGLKHANASNQPINITVLAWATDVQYSLPTSVASSALVVQAGDEYAKTVGPVEATATAVASLSSAMSGLPMVGPFARATTVAARAASAVASTFGMSRPAELAPHVGVTPKFISDLAPSGAGDNVSKLSLDIKQEVSIDPNVIGINIADEMDIAGIAAKESYLTSFNWTTAATATTRLWNTRVTPIVCQYVNSKVYQPACCFATVPFQYWRCKMRYRFQIVASAYHRGRLQITWDPLYASSIETNVQYTRIIDISDDRDITFEVDWGQPKQFLKVVPNIGLGYDNYGTAAITTASEFANGVLSISVFNELATPNSIADNDIAINVFVSAVDLQVNVPAGLINYVNSYAATVQSGEEMATINDGSDPGCGSATAEHVVGQVAESNDAALVYFGERITSFRQLLKRYTQHSNYALTVTSNLTIWRPTFSDTPIPYGFNNYALHSPTVAGKFNYVSLGLLQYLMPAYIAMRGSQRSKYSVISSNNAPSATLTVCRSAPGVPLLPAAATTISTTSNTTLARAMQAVRGTLLEGAVTTPLALNSVIEVEHPYYKPVRFDLARSAMTSTSATAEPEASPFYLCHSVELLASGAGSVYTMTRYTSVGEDFGLYWFQGCPPLDYLVPPV